MQFFWLARDRFKTVKKGKSLSKMASRQSAAELPKPDDDAEPSPVALQAADQQRSRACGQALADEAARGELEAGEEEDEQKVRLPKVSSADELLPLLRAAMPTDWNKEIKDFYEERLGGGKLFYPAAVPNCFLHPSSEGKDDALWVMQAQELLRLPPSRKQANQLLHGHVASAAGCEYLLVGFVLCASTSQNKTQLFHELTNQPVTNDWVAVLFNAKLNGCYTCTVRQSPLCCDVRCCVVCGGVCAWSLERSSRERLIVLRASPPRRPQAASRAIAR